MAKYLQDALVVQRGEEQRRGSGINVDTKQSLEEWKGAGRK